MEHPQEPKNCSVATATIVAGYSPKPNQHSFAENLCKGLVCGTPTRYKTQKRDKALPWKQLLMDTPQNLISSRSFSDKHFLKIWLKSLHGFGLWNTRKLCAPRRHQHRCPDGAGHDYKNAHITEFQIILQIVVQ